MLFHIKRSETHKQTLTYKEALLKKSKPHSISSSDSESESETLNTATRIKTKSSHKQSHKCPVNTITVDVETIVEIIAKAIARILADLNLDYLNTANMHESIRNCFDSVLLSSPQTLPTSYSHNNA